LRGQKNIHNLARFLTTFDFDREYLQKGSMRRKSEKKQLINNNTSHVERKKLVKKLVNYGPQTKML